MTMKTRTFGDLLGGNLYVALVLFESEDDILAGPVGKHVLQLCKLGRVLLYQLSGLALIFVGVICDSV